MLEKLIITFQIILIDIVMVADNAIIIGLIAANFAPDNRKKIIAGLKVAICGDIMHSRVARSNIHLLNTLGAEVRVIAPATLIPKNIESLGVKVFYDMKNGLKDVDIIIMLRLQLERMSGSFVPSIREYFWFYVLDIV